MTLQDAYLLTKNQLATVYDKDEAVNIANWIIENLTGMTRSDRLMDIGITLTIEQSSKLSNHIERLLQHEPVQYVLEECWFAGMKFNVNKHVLIPRPETEELVDWIIKDQSDLNTRLKILDIGTGSGCIPVSLQIKLPKAEVWSCDISVKAIEVATENASLLDAEKIIFQQLDFLDPEQTKDLPAFDIIVSNPPYIPEKDSAQMHANVLKYEPSLALFVPDNDPLVFYDAIAKFGTTHLHNAGCIYFEIHESLGKEVVDLLEKYQYSDIELKKDLQGKDRMVKAVFK
jgi:release factor glutamine methyltransferase